MNKLLKPQDLDLDPNSTSAGSVCKHLLRISETHVEDIKASSTGKQRACGQIQFLPSVCRIKYKFTP